jgi:ketosteroid isomerase-like protein
MIDRRKLLSLGAATVVGANAALADKPRGAVDLAKETVLARLNEQREAWNRGDLEGFCAAYDDDAVFLSPSGLTRGRAAVLARYLKKYGTAKETMGALSFESVDVKASTELVTMAMRWRLTWPEKPAAEGLTLIVWMNKAGTWKLCQDASM